MQVINVSDDKSSSMNATLNKNSRLGYGGMRFRAWKKAKIGKAIKKIAKPKKNVKFASTDNHAVKGGKKNLTRRDKSDESCTGVEISPGK